jgi:mono/diheme cytochrome c family protein
MPSVRQFHRFFPAAARRLACRSACAAVLAVVAGGLRGAEPPAVPSAAEAAPADHPGLAVYREHCVRCHGETGAGTPDVPDPLVGDRSVNQLAAYIERTMPEDDPALVTGAAARDVAAYIHESFYSPVARDRLRPARRDLARLTVRQLRSTLADVVGSFRGWQPPVDDRRGLRGEYFESRDFNRQKGLVFDRIDPQIDFDFGLEGPDPERFRPNRFAIRWTGALVAPETGVYEFVLRADHATRLYLNRAWYEQPLIDGHVKSGSENEYRASVFLLGGRPYPLRLEFSKAVQGVDDRKHEGGKAASIALLWRPPAGALELVPEERLLPQDAPEVFVPATPFPPDDRSIGYERGTDVSQDFFAAATAVAVETADYVLAHVEHLARVKPDAADRPEKLRAFAKMFAERCFREPLTPALEKLVVDRPFADAPDADTALKRSILAVLGSPRFLFRESPAAAGPFATAARLSFGLWDSIPDQPLRDAAARNQLGDERAVRAQAERMVQDRRARAKIHDFLLAWLRVDQPPDIAKDATRFSQFSPDVAAALRTSLHLFLDDVVWGPADRGGGDFRRLFTDDEVWIDGRLAPLYGVAARHDAPFRRRRIDDGRRAGVLTHPYMASVLSYPATTSPIHRGVFLARGVLGNVLKPPQDAVTPLAPELHPDLSTRERVALQTSSVACQSCHSMINDLGFALEEFDPIGRHRTVETRGGPGGQAGGKPIDASGSYLPREGAAATFTGGRELAAMIAGSRDAQEAFVQNLFHALVKQPIRAFGPDTLETLRGQFVAGGFDIRRLACDIMVVACSTPTVPAVPEKKP